MDKRSSELYLFADVHTSPKYYNFYWQKELSVPIKAVHAYYRDRGSLRNMAEVSRVYRPGKKDLRNANVPQM